jgi:hypothetical protein
VLCCAAMPALIVGNELIEVAGEMKLPGVIDDDKTEETPAEVGSETPPENVHKQK